MKNIFSTVLSLLFLITFASAQADFFGAGNDSGITVTSSSSFASTQDVNTINGSGMDAQRMEISRFLAQATMGYNNDEINRTLEIGIEAWIDEQQAMPAHLLTPLIIDINNELSDWEREYLLKTFREENPGVPITDEIIEQLEEEIDEDASALEFNYSWWQNLFSSEDQLRQRMAYALSQILVVSMISDIGNHGTALTTYYDILLRNGFGNYRDILEEVTLSPATGLFLSHYNNPRNIPEENLHPDENYAREIMQLFSIGLFELNLDGSRRQDADGNDIPTYNSNDIKEMAKVFTGLGPGDVMPNPYIDTPEFGIGWYLADKVVPMAMYQEWHSPTEKVLLDGLVIPAGQDGMQDISMALDYLFNHPNVGPFISRQLIQRFVKSNPSPQYITRTASVFNDNGQGVRGDLGAVIKAILTDEEARSCEAMQDPKNGKLQEALLRYSHYGKATDLVCLKDSTFVVNGEEMEYTECTKTRYWLNGFQQLDELKQAAMAAPTVFNFYLPNHQPVGEITQQGLVAPEFKIHDSTSSVNFMNMVFVSAQWGFYGGAWERELNEDLGWLTMTTDGLHEMLADPEDLINHLDLVFTRGQLSDRMRNNIRNFMDEQPAWVDEETLIRGVIFLFLSTPDYAILK